MNKKQLEILKEYLASASPEEARQLKVLMRDKSHAVGMSSMDISAVAKKTAADLHQSMGLTQKHVKKMARDLVIDMALQYKPDMSTREIQALINQLVPDREQQKKKIPLPVIRDMARHIIEYSAGIMPQEQRSNLSADWIEQYWAVMPESVQTVLKKYLKGSISLDDCWTHIKKLTS